MRAFLFLVAVLQILFGEVTFGSNAEQLHETMLIRRAYIDITGVMPTPNEIEWLIVYCDNSYISAIDYLYEKYNTKLIKKYVLSDAYKNQSPRLLSDIELNKSLLYLAGIDQSNPTLESNILKAKQSLIAQAIACSDGRGDTIDYICNLLMSRSSTVQENNKLNRIFNEVESASGEQQAWMYILKEILTYNDVRYK